MKDIKEENKEANTLMEDKRDYLNARKIKVSDCLHLDRLQEKTSYRITSINDRLYRGKTRYIFTIEGLEGMFISNSFMEQYKPELLIKNALIPFRTVTFKTTKNKTKEMVVVF